MMQVATAVASAFFASIALAAAAPAENSAASASAPPMIVNVTTADDVTPSLAARILAETDAIWRGGGVTFVWRRAPRVVVPYSRASETGPYVPNNLRVVIGNGVQRMVALKSYLVDVDHLDGDGVIKAPMHGKVLAILVAPGANVTKGERVAVVEAMKMGHALLAPHDGVVSEVTAEVGAQVAEGAKIMSIGVQE